MNNNNRKINFYTLGRQFTVRVFFVVWLCISCCNLGSALATQSVLGLFQTAIVALHGLTGVSSLMLKDSTAEAPAPLPMCSENDGDDKCCEYHETLRESFNQAENAKISLGGVEYNAGQIAALVESFWIQAGGFNCQSQCQNISLTNLLDEPESGIKIPNKYQFEDMAEALGCWIQDEEWGHDWSDCSSSLVITPTEDAIVPEDKEGMLYQISIEKSNISTEWVTSTVGDWLQDCQSALPEDRNAPKEYIPNQESLSGTLPQNRSSVD